MESQISENSTSNNTNTQIESIVWEIIHSYFRDNPQALVNHHIESYNDFFETSIQQVFREKNPLKWLSQYDETIEDYRSQCIMYLGGRDGSKLYFGKPVLYDNDKPHFLFPNEARLRNITYAMTIHYDIEVEYINILPVDSLEAAKNMTQYLSRLIVGGDIDEIEEDDTENEIPIDEQQKFHGGAEGALNKIKKQVTKKKVITNITPSEGKVIREYIEQSVTQDTNTGRIIQKRTVVFDKVFLGKFPIMIQSKQCILHGMPRDARYVAGECRNDPGGYFIIDGKEKVIVPQEKFGDNMMQLRKAPEDADIDYLYSCEIKSVSENVSKPVRTMNVRMMAPTKSYTNGQIVVNIPNVRAPIPLFILFRALGVLSDRDILETIFLDLEKYQDIWDLFIPSIHDAGGIYSQRNAIEYIAYLTKGKALHHGLEILADYFLPHVGETNYKEKAMFLGYMVFRMISVHMGTELPTDRDNFKYKRLELPGTLLQELFREYYTIQLKKIHLDFERQLKMNIGIYERDLPRLIQDHYQDVFRESGKIVDDGFKKAFKGNWGAFSHTKRIGVVQDLNRLSFNTMISHLRKTNLPIDSSLKIVGPRLCHSSQWGFIDPLDTPDGGNIGIHKNLSIATTVSRGYSRDFLVQWLREMIGMRLVIDHIPQELAGSTKVIVNGYWAGCVQDPIGSVEKIRTYRRNAMIPIHTSVIFKLNIIFMYTDAGRLCRPILYSTSKKRDQKTENAVLSIFNKAYQQTHQQWSWYNLTRGKHSNMRANAPWDGLYTRVSELYEGIPPDLESNSQQLIKFLETQAIVDYIDSNETENALIAINIDEFQRNGKTPYTHCEIHESLMFGVMTNQIPYPETNPPARNLFSCGQSKQAVSLYHTNYPMRMDKTAVVLNYGQIPLVKPRYGEYINNEENPYGFNAIVAIACYSGYNVEDAILINSASIQRGMFRTTYYTTYTAYEERGDITRSNKEPGAIPVDVRLTNVESISNNIVGMKPGFDYSKLDRNGLIQEGTQVDDKTILVGLTATGNTAQNRDQRVDNSIKPKRGQLGFVDKTYITEGEEGDRIAKVRISEERIPTLGDKFAGRAGQKGTIGMVIPECDMPFTKDGIRPDLIINPHAIPSRMTIGQLIETLGGKVAATYGAFVDSTAYGQKGSQTDLYGKILQGNSDIETSGFHQDAFESYGNEILYNGMTGEQIESSIFIGPVYYMRLKHMVKDKVQSRCLGPRSALTKQPVGGRANEGGLRVGEMERDSILAHGASCFLRESMMERGDKYYMAVCNKSGMLAIYNPSKNVFMSPMVDGPLKFIQDTTAIDQEMRVETITKFGRDFSVVMIPYALKLMIQELQSINISLRIITENNIQQLENMSFQTIKETANEYLRKLEKSVQESQKKEFAEEMRELSELQKGKNEWVIKESDELVGQNPIATTPDEPPEIDSPPFEPKSPPIIKDMEPWDEDSEYDYTHLLPPMKSRPQELKETQEFQTEQPTQTSWNIIEKSVIPVKQVLRKEDIVILKGDDIPRRKWVIDAIRTTENGTLLYRILSLDKENKIQVVKEDRLEVVPTQIRIPQMGGGDINSGRMIPFGNDDLQDQGRGQGHGLIHFAPVIVNGGNVGAPLSPDQIQPIVQNPNIQLPPLPIQNFMPSSKLPKKEESKEMVIKEAKEPTGKGWIQGAIDFTKKLMIKKTE